MKLNMYVVIQKGNKLKTIMMKNSFFKNVREVLILYEKIYFSFQSQSIDLFIEQ